MTPYGSVSANKGQLFQQFKLFDGLILLPNVRTEKLTHKSEKFFLIISYLNISFVHEMPRMIITKNVKPLCSSYYLTSFFKSYFFSCIFNQTFHDIYNILTAYFINFLLKFIKIDFELNQTRTN